MPRQKETPPVQASEEGSPQAAVVAPRPRRAPQRRRGRGFRKTVHVTAADVAAGRAELDALGVTEHQRPKVRGECLAGPRPCPYVSCKQNLYLDVGKRGTIILNFPGSDPGEMSATQSCALDLAEAGGMTLEEVAAVTNLTRERVRQIEKRALLLHARPLAVELGLGDK